MALDVVRELDHQVRGAQEPDWKLEIRLVEVGESIEGSDRRTVAYVEPDVAEEPDCVWHSSGNDDELERGSLIQGENVFEVIEWGHLGVDLATSESESKVGDCLLVLVRARAVA